MNNADTSFPTSQEVLLDSTASMNGKKASSPSRHCPPFQPTHEASARLRATSTRLLHFHPFILEWTVPLPGPQTPYLSLSTFKAGPNASSSMKLSINPHLALVLAESVAPNGLCLHFHYSTDPSGLPILALSAFSARLPAPSGQGFAYSLAASQCLAIITACCKEWTFQQMFSEFC